MTWWLKEPGHQQPWYFPTESFVQTVLLSIVAADALLLRHQAISSYNADPVPTVHAQ